MPSKTFINLPEEKKNKLIISAINEFSNNTFFDVSINKIVINAGIPRGSFYMYFNDKVDLFEYIVDSYTIRLKEIVNNSLKSTNGDLRNTFDILFDETFIRIKKIKYKIFFENIFIFFNLNRDKFLFKGHDLFEEVKENINKDYIKTNDLEFIFTTLMHTLFIGISDALQNDDHDKEKQSFLRKLDMVCYGFYKY